MLDVAAVLSVLPPLFVAVSSLDSWAVLAVEVAIMSLHYIT